jgi:aminobenzoyl-glutamate utilization protein A
MDGFGANDAGVVALRRDLHAHPEQGFLEYRTASLAADRLARLGYDVKVGPQVMSAGAMFGAPPPAAIAAAQREALAAGAPPAWVEKMPGGQTGVVAELARGDGPVLALRFDMDALPVLESTAEAHRPRGEGFRSRRDGTMHACGHDGHTAIGLALAERLAHPAADWRGTLRLIFQPAEEGGRGAWPMVRAGVVDDADWFFACHLGCKLPTGQIAAQATGFLFSRKLDVAFAGQAAHAAMAPQEGRNALLAAATAALGLHAIARHGDGATHVNVGTLVAGGGRNVIADHALMRMEVRGDTQASLDYMIARATQVLEGAAAMQGVTLATTLMGETIGATASDAAAALVAEAATGLDGVDAVLPEWPMGGGEDATFMMRRVRERGGEAAFFILGSDIAAGHHASAFDIDERALDIGVRLFERLARRVLGGGASS